MTARESAGAARLLGALLAAALLGAAAAPARAADGGPTTVLHVPGTILSLDTAASPRSGWPAVVAVAQPLTLREGPLVYVRALNPTTRRWENARTLGVGPSQLARTRFRTAQVAIGPDDRLHVVWGAAADGRLGLYAAASSDYGATWEEPRRIATATRGVLDLAVGGDGAVVALALSSSGRAVVVRRTPAGRWLAPEELPISTWYGATGALAAAGPGLAAVVSLPPRGGRAAALALASSPAAGGQWRVERRAIPGGAPLLSEARAVAFDGGALFTLVDSVSGSVVAVQLAPGGAWGDAEVAAGRAGALFAAPAHDSQRGRLVVFWTCCDDARFAPATSTHYAEWRPDSGAGRAWLPSGGREGIPLVSGAAAAGATSASPAHDDAEVWLAWVEAVHQVQLRRVRLPDIDAGEVGP